MNIAQLNTDLLLIITQLLQILIISTMVKLYTSLINIKNDAYELLRIDPTMRKCHRQNNDVIISA